MLDVLNAAPVSAASASPDRADLAAAHAARCDAEGVLAAAREAADRGRELHAQAETVLGRHREAMAQRTQDRAAVLKAAIMSGAGHDLPQRPAHEGRGEAAALLVAEQEAEAARLAHADLEGAERQAEQRLADARKAVDRAIKAVLHVKAVSCHRELNETREQVKWLEGVLCGFENSYGRFGEFTITTAIPETTPSFGDPEFWQKFYRALDTDPHAALDD